MILYGLQKMTLLDFPGKVACTVFLSGCDYRCPFCHNFELVDGTAPAVMDEKEFFSFLEKREGLLDGVAVTGGEPCLRKELPAFLREIKDRGFLVKLDTNGAHPYRLAKILQEGLADYVAMDIKNSPAKYALTVGLGAVNLDAVRESASLLMTGETDFEFRTTVVREFHEKNDFEEVGKWIEGAPRYFLQPFTDRETVPFGGLHAPGREEMEQFLQIARKYVPAAEIRGME